MSADRATKQPEPAELIASHLTVVSDVHGYLDDLRHGLQDAGLVDADHRWVGDDRTRFGASPVS